MTVMLTQDNEKELFFSVLITTSNKCKGAYMYTMVAALINDVEEYQKMNSSAILYCDDTVITNQGYSMNADGDIIDSTEWLLENLGNNEYDEDELNAGSIQ